EQVKQQLLGAALVASAALVGPTAAFTRASELARIAYVIDGDTFRLESGERIRIADAAETDPGQAKCRAEIARGNAATQEARALLDGRTVTIERVGRSYNRTIATIRFDGRDVATMLVARGIAAG